MTFHWSKNAQHSLSVFPPWQEQDGYALPILVAAEQALGVSLPIMLKNFYHAWGRRRDLTRTRETLLNPDQLTVRSGGLIFTEENQAVYVWAIPCTALQMPNPPVYYAELVSEPAELQWLPSHTHLSDFFDYLTYGHALACGSPHGGVAHEAWSEALHAAITQQWKTIELVSVPMGLYPDPAWRWVVYGESGIVIDGTMGEVWVAARTVELRETVRQQLHLTWKNVW